MRYGNDSGSSIIPALTGLLVLFLLVGGGYYLYKHFKTTDEQTVDYPSLPVVTFTPRPSESLAPTPAPTATPVSTPTPSATPSQVAGSASSNLPKSGPETDLPALAAIASSVFGAGYYVRLKKRLRSAYRDQAVDSHSL